MTGQFMYPLLKRTIALTWLIATTFLTADAQGQVNVFGRGLDNTLYYKRLGAPASEWHSLQGELTSAADACSTGQGQMDVFARGPDNALWQITGDGDLWVDWIRLDGNLASAPAAVSWGPDQISVFAVGTDHALYQKVRNGRQWTGWQPLGGTFPEGASPDAISRGPNLIDVFMRGMDNALWTNSFDGTRWNGWTKIGGVLNSDPGAASWGRDRIDVFALGTDNAMYQITNAGHGWSQWFPQGGLFDPGSGPDATASAFNRLEVVQKSSDKAYWIKRWDGTSWSQWQSLSGAFSSDPTIVTMRGSEETSRSTFRVTLNGFTVEHETTDDPLERDGRRDEVYIVAEVWTVNRDGNVTARRSLRSFVMGDNSRGGRVRAGAASSVDGGLRTGDVFPTLEPWRLTLEPRSDRLPMLLWEGSLARGENIALILPTIWEWDREERSFCEDVWGQTLDLWFNGGRFPDAFAYGTRWRGIKADSMSLITESSSQYLREGRGSAIKLTTITEPGFDESGNRPIGLQRVGSEGSIYQLTPGLLQLTFDSAQRAATTEPSNRGLGVIEVRYHDLLDDEGGPGDYILYLQVQAVR